MKLTTCQSNRQTIAYRHLWQLVDELTNIYQSHANADVPADTLLPLLKLEPESQMQRVIRDIIDELDIMIQIMEQQNDVITKFTRLAGEILDASDDADAAANAPFSLHVHIDSATGTNTSAGIHGSGSGSLAHALRVEPQPRDSSPSRAQKQRREFKRLADDLLSEIAARMNELKGLKRSAGSTQQIVRSSSPPPQVGRCGGYWA